LRTSTVCLPEETKTTFKAILSVYLEQRGSCSDVIRAYSELADISLREAFDVFYKSNLYTEIRDGISDMHCRSDGCLAEELQREAELICDADSAKENDG